MCDMLRVSGALYYATTKLVSYKEYLYGITTKHINDFSTFERLVVTFAWYVHPVSYADKSILYGLIHNGFDFIEAIH